MEGVDACIGSNRPRPSSWNDDDPKAARSYENVQFKSGSPLLMLSLEDGNCRVYNPEEDRIYETTSDLSGCRFLANSGKWFLVLDPRFHLHIIDVFSDVRIRLPPLESFKGDRFKVERVKDEGFTTRLVGDKSTLKASVIHTLDDVKGLLWVDEKDNKVQNYVVVWRFDHQSYLGYCKSGDSHYHEIKTRTGVCVHLRGQQQMALKGYNLYLRTTHSFIRILDLSGKDGFKDVSENHKHPMWTPRDEYIQVQEDLSSNENIVVTESGEVLIVCSRVYKSTSDEVHREFRLFKRDPKDIHLRLGQETRLVELFHEYLDGKALFVDLGVILPADSTLGIEPKSIYFTRDDRFQHQKLSYLDIYVYNLETGFVKSFTHLNNLKIKDAQWFIPN